MWKLRELIQPGFGSERVGGNTEVAVTGEDDRNAGRTGGSVIVFVIADHHRVNRRGAKRVEGREKMAWIGFAERDGVTSHHDVEGAGNFEGMQDGKSGGLGFVCADRETCA